MKIGVTLSSAAHVAILTWGMFNLSAPTPLEVADVEALPVDIVPIEEFTQSVAGDKQADFSQTPAPVPTERPISVENATNVGESENDLKSVREADVQPDPVEVAKAETPPPAPEPTPSPEVNEEAKPVEEETPAPATELASVNEEAVPVTEEAVSEEAAIEDLGEQFAKLPETIPVPAKRPEAPKPKTAETTKRKKEEKPAQSSTATADKNDQNVTDDIASLLNKQDPTAAGAKASKKQKSLGTKKPSKSGKLSTSEMDALRTAIERCWSVPSGISEVEDMRVTVTMQLSPDGEIEGRPKVSATGGESSARRAFAGSAKRAVQKCAPYSLPSNKYDTWAEVVVNFDASEMF